MLSILSVALWLWLFAVRWLQITSTCCTVGSSMDCTQRSALCGLQGDCLLHRGLSQLLLHSFFPFLNIVRVQAALLGDSALAQQCVPYGAGSDLMRSAGGCGPSAAKALPCKPNIGCSPTVFFHHNWGSSGITAIGHEHRIPCNRSLWHLLLLPPEFASVAALLCNTASISSNNGSLCERGAFLCSSSASLPSRSPGSPSALCKCTWCLCK